MAIIYFDSSALVKLVVNEAGSGLAAALWNSCDAALSSRLAYPEVCAALAAAGRNHDLTASETSAAIREWEVFWASMRSVELSSDVEQQAGQLARHHHLSGADSIHLASALALQTTDLMFAVWDKRLHAGALASGLALAPATLA